MKKTSKLTIKKLSLSKKTVSLLGTQADQIVGGCWNTDPYSGGGPGTYTCTYTYGTQQANCQPQTANCSNTCYTAWTVCGYCG